MKELGLIGQKREVRKLEVGASPPRGLAQSGQVRLSEIIRLS
jgi:hypothetical protein